MARLYGRAPKGERCRPPLRTATGDNLLHGRLAHQRDGDTYVSGRTDERRCLLAYVRQVLVPELSERRINEMAAICVASQPSRPGVGNSRIANRLKQPTQERSNLEDGIASGVPLPHGKSRRRFGS